MKFNYQTGSVYNCNITKNWSLWTKQGFFLNMFIQTMIIKFFNL